MYYIALFMGQHLKNIWALRLVQDAGSTQSLSLSIYNRLRYACPFRGLAQARGGKRVTERVEQWLRKRRRERKGEWRARENGEEEGT